MSDEYKAIAEEAVAALHRATADNDAKTRALASASDEIAALRAELARHGVRQPPSGTSLPAPSVAASVTEYIDSLFGITDDKSKSSGGAREDIARYMGRDICDD